MSGKLPTLAIRRHTLKNITLPKTLNGLLGVAVSDAKSLSRELYIPHFAYWHRPHIGQRCEVCLAGSLIAGSLECNRNYNVLVHMLDETLKAKVEALNAMRRGDFTNAYRILYNRRPSPRTHTRLDELPVPAHPEFVGWQQFNAHLRSLDAIIPRLREIEETRLA